MLKKRDIIFLGKEIYLYINPVMQQACTRIGTTTKTKSQKKKHIHQIRKETFFFANKKHLQTRNNRDKKKSRNAGKGDEKYVHALGAIFEEPIAIGSFI